MSSWAAIQKHIATEDLIAEVKVSSVTPIRVGGYNARPYSPELELFEKPRTQAIKGLWRWWARAILAGAKISADKDLQTNLSKLDEEINLSKLNQDISEIFGSTDGSSKFNIQLFIEDIDEVNYDLSRVPRLSLGKRKRKKEVEKTRGDEEKYYEVEFSILLKINSNIALFKEGRGKELIRNNAMFALSSLLVSLIFSGVGSITTRGFGKLKIKEISPGSHFKEEVLKLEKLVKGLFQNENKVIYKLEELISLALNHAARSKGLGTLSREVTLRNTPMCSVLLPNCDPPIFKIDLVCVSSKRIPQILTDIGESTTKIAWKSKADNTYGEGKHFHTWVLGLPRSQELPYEKNGEKVKELTGYVFDGKKEIRKQSPIGFTILELKSGRYAIVMYGFYTREFAQLLTGYTVNDTKYKLKHRGIHVDKSRVPSLKKEKVIGVLKEDSVNETIVFDDIKSKGIETFSGKFEVKSSDPICIYRECFDAAYDFVKKLIKSRCSRNDF